MQGNKSQSELSLCHVDFYSRKLKTRGTVFEWHCSNTLGKINHVQLICVTAKFPEKMNESNKKLPQTCWEEGWYKGQSLKFASNKQRRVIQDKCSFCCTKGKQVSARVTVLCCEYAERVACTLISPRYNMYQPYYLKTSSWGKNREVIPVWHQLFLWKRKKSHI